MALRTDIAQALIDRIKVAAVALPVPLPLALTGTTAPDPGVRYLEVKHFPNDPENITWKTPSMHGGIFQVGLVDPALNGPIEPSEILDAIGAYFAKGTELRSGVAVVKIHKEPGMQSVIEDGHKRTYPLSISYRCFG